MATPYGALPFLKGFKMGRTFDPVTAQKFNNGVARTDADFAPSSYSAIKSATTTVTGQSEAIASGAVKLRIVNLDGSNYGLVAFGTDAATAESNAANGVVCIAGSTNIISIPANANYYSWLGDTGTVSLAITQGA